jgi:hypothetical protein
MGSGEVAGSKSITDSPWVHSPPDAQDEAFWKFACGTKLPKPRP